MSAASNTQGLTTDSMSQVFLLKPKMGQAKHLFMLLPDMAIF